LKRHPHLPTSRTALYELLGLVDRGPDPNASCGNCDACRGILETGSSSYGPAQRAGEARIADDPTVQDRLSRMIRAVERGMSYRRSESDGPHVVAFDRYIREA
jgi:hypothetical protein